MISDDVERKIFKRSFLKNIQFVFSYDPLVLWSEKLVEQISRFLANLGYEISDVGTVSLVQGKKSGICVNVTDRGVVVTTSLEDYKNFENFLNILLEIKGIFEIFKCTKLKNFMFQKLNLYKLGPSKSGELPSKDNVFKTLFADNVFKDDKPVFDMDSNYFFSMQPAFNEYEGFVVAKLLVSTIRVEPIELVELEAELKYVNNIMFKMWFGGVSEKVKNIMDK